MRFVNLIYKYISMYKLNSFTLTIISIYFFAFRPIHLLCYAQQFKGYANLKEGPNLQNFSICDMENPSIHQFADLVLNQTQNYPSINDDK